MAHRLKYYKDIEAHGHEWRMEILQDTSSSVTPVEIGPVLQGLRLVMQGDQADIDTPIVKTSLEMVFVDAPDKEDGRKCGYWEEFYTSSATEYQVRLYKDGTLEWTGYVTPDSFSEDLRYRGSVTIIARDNLGTLQDTTFDMRSLTNIDNRVYIWELVEKALSISTCALDCDIFEYSLPQAVDFTGKNSSSNLLLYQMVDVQAFKDKSWWDALEEVLYACGLCLKYVGRNKLALTSLRDIPKCGASSWYDVPEREVQFLAYGRRELVPGIKNIKESVEYDVDAQHGNETIDDYVKGDVSSIASQYIIMRGPSAQWSGAGSPTHGYLNNRKQQYTMSWASPLLDVSAYSKVRGEDSEEYGQWDDPSIIYYHVNATEERPVNIIQKVHSPNGKVTIRLTADKPVSLLSDLSAVLNTPISRAVEYGTSAYLNYRLTFTSSTGALSYYSDGKWSATIATKSVAINPALFYVDKPNQTEVEIKDIPLPGVGIIGFEIVSIFITPLSIVLRRNCIGMYMRLKDIGIEVSFEEKVLLSKVTLTTEYSNDYSVRLTRSPELGILPSSAPEVAYVPNAITAEAAAQYIGADQWAWNDGAATGISLSRLIHQQLIAFHAKPNNVLTGELIDKGGDMPDFNSLWIWNGKEHMLMSGALNILTGRMENAVLREFTRYEDMWND